MDKFAKIPDRHSLKTKDGRPWAEDEKKVNIPTQTVGDYANIPESVVYLGEEVNSKALELPNGPMEILEKTQAEIQKQTLMTTAMATAVSYSFRRSYLDENDIVKIKSFDYKNYNQQPIFWAKLKSVGTSEKFGIQESILAIEYILHSCHAPSKYRLFYIASSDAVETTIYIGIQSIAKQTGTERTVVDVIKGYAHSIWPGLEFESIEKFENPIKHIIASDSVSEQTNYIKYKNTRVCAFTGIPAPRLRDGKTNNAFLSNTIDKLSEALYGKKWTYLIIADPVATTEVDKIQHICRDFSGKIESFKKLSISESFSSSISHTFGENEGYSENTPTSQFSNFALGGGVGAAVGIAASAAIAALAPELIVLAPKIIAATTGIGAMAARPSTTTHNGGVSESTATSFSESNNIGQEILNKHAEKIADLLNDQIRRYQISESLGTWSVGTYLVAEDKATLDIGANIIKSLASGDNSHFEPIRSYDFLPASGMYEKYKDPLAALINFMAPQTCFQFNSSIVLHPLGQYFDELKMLVNTRELSNLISFPLNNIPGIEVKSVPPSTCLSQHLCNTDGVTLGTQIYRGNLINAMPFDLSVKSLAKHALVAGINGSGKTTTIKKILAGMGNYPFMVIEPAKTEYVDWAIANNNRILQQCGGDRKKASQHNEWINVYMPGRTKWRSNNENLEQISLNPFDFVWLPGQDDPHVLEHIDNLKTIVNAVLPMQEVLPVLMEELIYKVYTIKTINQEGTTVSWLPTGKNSAIKDRSAGRPTFVQLCMHIDSIVDSRGYESRIAGNLKAALKTRLISFMRGWRNSIFNNEASEPDKWQNLFNKRTVINLTSLASDDDKAFFMAVILLFLYEYRQACDEIKSDDSFKSLLVLEEAHRILQKTSAANMGSANPQGKVSMMFSHILSELRAYGQGVLIADQVPSRLNEDAIKNTNLKIVHKLVASDDREAMATALNLRPDQVRMIGDLLVGEVLVRGDMDKEAFHVKVKA